MIYSQINSFFLLYDYKALSTYLMFPADQDPTHPIITTASSFCPPAPFLSHPCSPTASKAVCAVPLRFKIYVKSRLSSSCSSDVTDKMYQFITLTTDLPSSNHPISCHSLILFCSILFYSPTLGPLWRLLRAFSHR